MELSPSSAVIHTAPEHCQPLCAAVSSVLNTNTCNDTVQWVVGQVETPKTQHLEHFRINLRPEMNLQVEYRLLRWPLGTQLESSEQNKSEIKNVISPWGKQYCITYGMLQGMQQS